MYAVHEGEVKVLWKGARSTSWEAGAREGCPSLVLWGGQKVQNYKFLWDATRKKSVTPKVKSCG